MTDRTFPFGCGRFLGSRFAGVQFDHLQRAVLDKLFKCSFQLLGRKLVFPHQGGIIDPGFDVRQKFLYVDRSFATGRPPRAEIIAATYHKRSPNEEEIPIRRLESFSDAALCPVILTSARNCDVCQAAFPT